MFDFKLLVERLLLEQTEPFNILDTSWMLPVLNKQKELFNTPILSLEKLRQIYTLATGSYISPTAIQPYLEYDRIIDFIANTNFGNKKPDSLEDFLSPGWGEKGTPKNKDRALAVKSLTRDTWVITNTDVIKAITSYDSRNEINAEPYKNLSPLEAITKLLTSQKGYDVNLSKQIIQYPLSVNKNFTQNRYIMTSIYNIALDLLLYFRSEVMKNSNFYIKQLNIKDDQELKKNLELFAGNEKANTPAGIYFKQLYVEFVGGK
jgi:hypothetical protein